MFKALVGTSDKQRCRVSNGMMTMFSFHVCHCIPCLNAHANAQTITNTCTSHERIPDWLCVEKPACEHNSLVLLCWLVPFVLSESANTSNLKLRCITCTCLGNNQNKTSAAYPPSHFLLLCFRVEIMPWCLCTRACRIWQSFLPMLHSRSVWYQPAI